MKQITMDFDLYEAELAEERKIGVGLAGDLDELLRKALRYVVSYDRAEFDKGVFILNDLINKIDRAKK